MRRIMKGFPDYLCGYALGFIVGFLVLPGCVDEEAPWTGADQIECDKGAQDGEQAGMGCHEHGRYTPEGYASEVYQECYDAEYDYAFAFQACS